MRQRPHDRHHRADRHGAGKLGLRLVADAHGVVQRQQMFGLRQERPPARIERDGAARAVEQVAAQLGLERTHLQAHGGLRERHALGSGGKRAMARHCDEGAEKADRTHRRNLKIFLSNIK